MQTFYILLTLSSLKAPQVLFMGQSMPFKNESACIHALPKMEGAVSRLIRYDASTLKLFGTTVGGQLNPSYFVSASECKSAAP